MPVSLDDWDDAQYELAAARKENRRLRAALWHAWQTEGGVRKEDDHLYDELSALSHTESSR